MSVSAIFGTKLLVTPLKPTSYSAATKAAPPSRVAVGDVGLMTIECSSRPQKKATAHHKKTRPRKTNPYDIRRGPAVYPPLPSMPAEWSFVSDDGVAAEEPQLEVVEPQ